MSLKIRKPNSSDVQFGHKLSSVPVGLGLPTVDELWEEMQEYIDVILGREESPIQSPYLSLAEVATAYYCRAQEIDAKIHAGERSGDIVKGSPYYRFRTGELRSFIELAKKAAELGSRRLTQESLLQQQRIEGG
jgi:hypothetical protein